MQRIIDKMMGGRWITTVLIISTYCYAIITVINLVKDKTLPVETFLGMFAAFALLSKDIVTGYFDRTDRVNSNQVKEESLQVKTTTTNKEKEDEKISTS